MAELATEMKGWDSVDMQRTAQAFGSREGDRPVGEFPEAGEEHWSPQSSNRTAGQTVPTRNPEFMLPFCLKLQLWEL